MISFPLLRRLTVVGYDLYPGPAGDKIMDLRLDTGPWMILGVNGLGKSTLLLLMRYLIAGSVRTRPAGFAGEREDLQAVFNRLFAVRVADDARDAVASLEVGFGDRTLKITRRLSNLMLVSAEIIEADGMVETIVVEAAFRMALAELMQLEQFDDAIRVLDHITFYLEARQALIWDGAAQFEVFRALLTPSTSAQLRKLEGEIVSNDSAARNLNAVLSKITTKRNREAGKLATADDTRARLAALQADIHAARASEETLRAELDGLEEERDNARLNLKRAEKGVDDAAQTYERLKFDTLRTAFEGVAPTEQYLFLKMMSDRVCMVCAQPAEDAAQQAEDRLAQGRCVVCGNLHAQGGSSELPEDWRTKAEDAFTALEQARAVLVENQATYDDRALRAKQTSDKLEAVRRDIDGNVTKATKLSKALPVGDAARLDQEQSRISALSAQVKEFQDERKLAEGRIEGLLTSLKHEAEKIAQQLQDRFNTIAKPFFAERVQLVYAPRDSRIGQTGKMFSFPAFEVEMTSGATHGEFVRRRSDQVSLSQREYLDLIFRMVLLDIVGGGGGSLVVDGPEGSVDAVFAERAGDLFARFASHPAANAILACNIVEGGFIPHTLQAFPGDLARTRVVNLLDQAVPTAALRELRPLYLEKVDQILGSQP